MKYTNPIAIQHIAGACILVAIAGCGGGGTANTTGSDGSGKTTLSGTVFKGPVQGAEVCAYATDATGAVTTKIGCVSSDSTGNYLLDLTGAMGVISIAASGGTYTDEATGETRTLDALKSAIVLGSGTNFAAVTPLTTIAVNKAISGGGLTEANVSATVASISNAYGIDNIISTPPATVTVQPAANESAASLTYGLVLAGFSAYSGNTTQGNVSQAIQKLSSTSNGLGGEAQLFSANLQNFITSRSNLTGIYAVPSNILAAAQALIEAPWCKSKLTPATMVDISSNYSSELLDSSSHGATPIHGQVLNYYLTSNGFASWVGTDSPGAKLFRYSPITKSITSFTPFPELIGPPQLIGLDREGLVVFYRPDPWDQYRDLGLLNNAYQWDGTNHSIAPVNMAMSRYNRGDRISLFRGMSGQTNDGTGRAWAFTSAVSYIDSGTLIDSYPTLLLGPIGSTNDHCGRAALLGSGDPFVGIYVSSYLNNIETLNFTGQLSKAMPTNQVVSELAMMNNQQTVTGTANLMSTIGGDVRRVGFIKGPGIEVLLENTQLLDINDRTVAVGASSHVASEFDTFSGLTIYNHIYEDGVIVAGGQKVSIKELVPAWRQSTNLFIPIRINNAGQMLVQECSPSDNCASLLQLHLITPA